MGRLKNDIVVALVVVVLCYFLSVQHDAAHLCNIECSVQVESVIR